MIYFTKFIEGKKKGKFALAHAMKAYKESGGMAVLILNHCAGWRRVVSITSRAFYPWELTLLLNEYVAAGAPEPVWAIWRLSAGI